ARQLTRLHLQEKRYRSILLADMDLAAAVENTGGRDSLDDPDSVIEYRARLLFQIRSTKEIRWTKEPVENDFADFGGGLGIRNEPVRRHILVWRTRAVSLRRRRLLLFRLTLWRLLQIGKNALR